MIFAALLAINLVFVAYPTSQFEGQERIIDAAGYGFGTAMGGLIGGGLVAFILKFFWKKHTVYELWFASASIWLGFFVVSKISGFV